MASGKEIADPDLEQMRKLSVFRKLIRTILADHWCLLLLSFLLSFAAVLTLLVWKTEKSPVRFETRVNLLYFPKKSAKVQSIDERNLMQIFTRHLMFQKLCGELHLDKSAVADLIPTIEVIQNRKQPNLYTVVARDRKAEGAILKANTFADLCVREYIAFRSDDLKKHEEVILRRKNATQDALRELQKEEAALCGNFPAASPADELLRLQKKSSEVKAMLAETEIQLANEQVKRDGIQTLLKDVSPALFDHIGTIRDFIAELEKLDTELISARQLYTGLNPRLRMLENRRNAIAREYDAFLKRHGIENVDKARLRSLETLNGEAAEAEDRILRYAERRAALARTLENGREQADRIRKVIPDFKNIEDRRRIVQETFRLNEEILSEISYLQASLPNEVSQMERSSSVVGKSLFSKRNIAFSLAAAMLFTGLLSVLVISFELMFGKVCGWQELSLYPELNLLGFLPPRLDMLGSKVKINGVLDSLYYHFQSVSKQDRVVFCGCLEGGEKAAEVRDRLEWNCSLSGRKLFRLKITDISPGQEKNDIALSPENPGRNGSSGFLRVETVYVLRSPE